MSMVIIRLETLSEDYNIFSDNNEMTQLLLSRYCLFSSENVTFFTIKHIHICKLIVRIFPVYFVHKAIHMYSFICSTYIGYQ